MAKYQITHSCGHTEEVVLFGKVSIRHDRIAWLEGQKCKACWLEERRAAENALPIEMHININAVAREAEITLTGGTYPRKDQIKQLGYRWGEVRGGLMDFLSGERPQKAWRKYIPLQDFVDDRDGCTAKITTDAQSLSAVIKNTTTALDLAAAAKAAIAKEEPK